MTKLYLYISMMGLLIAVGLMTLAFPTPAVVVQSMDLVNPTTIPEPTKFVSDPKKAFAAVQERFEQMNRLRYLARAAHAVLLAVTGSYDSDAFAVVGTSGKRMFLNHSTWHGLPWPITPTLRGLRFTDEQVRSTADRIDDICTTAKEHDADCLVMTIPTKYSLYHDDLPGYLQPVRPGPATALRRYRPDAYDATASITPHDDEKCSLYFPLDHHWAPVAAYAAFIGLLNSTYSEQIEWSYDRTGRLLASPRTTSRALDYVGYHLSNRYCEADIDVQTPPRRGKTLILGQSFSLYAENFGVFDALFEDHHFDYFRTWRPAIVEDHRPNLVIVALSEHWIPLITY